MSTYARVPALVRRRGLFAFGALAGLAGGVIEVAWIALYQHLAGHEAAAVARGVTQSLLPGLASAPAAVPLGLRFTWRWPWRWAS